MSKETGEALTQWRVRLKKSQREMAHYLGVSTNTYIQWEAGRREPPAIGRRLFEVLQGIELAAPAYHRTVAASPPPGRPGPRVGSPARDDTGEPVPEWMS